MRTQGFRPGLSLFRPAGSGYSRSSARSDSYNVGCLTTRSRPAGRNKTAQPIRLRSVENHAGIQPQIPPLGLKPSVGMTASNFHSHGWAAGPSHTQGRLVARKRRNGAPTVLVMPAKSKGRPPGRHAVLSYVATMTPVGVASHFNSFRATWWLVLPKILLPFPRTIGMVSNTRRSIRLASSSWG